jgi:hypothetical protein
VRATVFAAADGSGEAQGELLSVLVDYLQSRYPDIYHLDGDTMTIGERRVGSW